MPTKRFPTYEGDQPRLELSWQSYWNDLVVRFDDEEVASVERYTELKKNGRRFCLPDGRVLELRIMSTFNGRRLAVLVDGAPVPGSDTHPNAAIRSAFRALLGLSAMLLVGPVTLAIATRASGAPFDVTLWVMRPSLIFIVGYAVLALLVRKGSRSALILALVVMGVHLAFFSLHAIFSRPLVLGGRVFAFAWVAALQVRALRAARYRIALGTRPSASIGFSPVSVPTHDRDRVNDIAGSRPRPDDDA